MPRGLVVAAVEQGSIAEEMGISPNDRVVAVSGQEVGDIVDFQYLTADEEYTLWVEKPGGELWELEIERSPDEFLGLSFVEVCSKGLRYCQNNCVFCFVAQMPKGMRKSLYHKDDDYRLSLTQGSYITLSNLKKEELDRIIRLHLSPLYISVHAWDSKVRTSMMKNPRAGDLSSQLKRLAQAGIVLHTQIVLVPGYNDGEVLKETVRELGALFPAVQSIAVVPVGLTRFRTALTPLRPFSSEEAKELLEWGESCRDLFFQRLDRHLLYFSDEFYALAGESYPPPEIYDDFPQLENGVGMATKFNAEISAMWESLPERISPRRIHVVTGSSAYPFFREWQAKLEAKIKNLTVTVHRIENQFFGPTVTVAGLLTAADIASQIKCLDGEYFLIPSVMLKADQDLFLDDKDVEWLEEQINGTAIIVENEGTAFLEAVVGHPLDREEDDRMLE